MYKILLLTLLLVGCGNQDSSTSPNVDVCLQKVYFDDCMAALPAGPTSTNYNDWSEVVSACRDIAQSLAYRQNKDIKEECKTGYTY